MRQALAADRKRRTEILALPEAKGRALAEQLFLSDAASTRSAPSSRPRRPTRAPRATPSPSRPSRTIAVNAALAKHPAATTRVVAGLRARGFRSASDQWGSCLIPIDFALRGDVLIALTACAGAEVPICLQSPRSRPSFRIYS